MTSVALKNNPNFQKLMELKAKYMQKKMLLVGVTQASPAKEEEDSDTPVPKEETPEPVDKTPKASTSSPAPPSPVVNKQMFRVRRNRNNLLDSEQLRIVVKRSLLGNGGDAHMDTMVEYIRNKWPNLRKKDGLVYTRGDLKKTVVSMLSECPMFEINEDEVVSFSVEGRRNVGPDLYPTCVYDEILSVVQGGRKLDIRSLTEEVRKNWTRKGVKVDSNFDNLVLVCVETDPRFRFDGKYVLLPPKKRRRNGSQNGRKRKSESSPEDETRRSKRAHVATDDASTGNDSKKSTSEANWICCDRCNEWIDAKRDGITDMWIYDDQNPDHIDYYCPACREAQGKKTSRRRSEDKRARNRGRPTKEDPIKARTVPAARKRRKPNRGAASDKISQAIVELLEDFKACYNYVDYDSDDIDTSDLDPAKRLKMQELRDFKRRLFIHRKDLLKQRDKAFKKNERDLEDEIAELQRQYEEKNKEYEAALVQKMHKLFEEEVARVTRKAQVNF